jgi:hypothetical protein
MVDEPTTFASITRLEWGRLAIGIALFVILSAAVPYAIHRELGAEAPSLDNRWLTGPFLSACLALLALYFASDGLRLYYTLRSLGYRVPLRDLGPLVFINILVSNITPLATGGGFAQIWYLTRLGVHLGAATAATTLRTLLAVAFIFIPTPFLLVFMPTLQNRLAGSWPAFCLAAVALLYLAFFAVVLLRMKWILALVDAILLRWGRSRLIDPETTRRRHRRIRREIIRFSRSVRRFFHGPPIHIFLAVFFTAVFLLSLFSFPALLLWGLAYRVDYPTSVGLLVVTTFILYFSPTPGAAGIAEGVFGIFFADRVAAGDLLLIIVAWRFLTIHLGMLIGVPVTAYTLLRKDGRHA